MRKIQGATVVRIVFCTASLLLANCSRSRILCSALVVQPTARSTIKSISIPGHTTTRSATKLSLSSEPNNDEQQQQQQQQQEQQLTRRQIGELSIASVGLGTSFLATRENKPTDYGLYGVLPIGPYKRKKTILTTIVPNQIWTLDQKFGILNVQVPSRATIVKLSTGGLFVYDPVAATPECLALLRSLEAEHGPVRHIVLGSVAIEHKVYAGVFAQKFPKAEVWLQPGQYSFPTDLPDPFLGFPAARTRTVPPASTVGESPDGWKEDFDWDTLGPVVSRDGAFGETVFFHRDSGTLLCTDTVLEVTDEVPLIFEEDPKPLLYHARDYMEEDLVDSEEVRKKGWRRVVLFGLFFSPDAIRIKTVDEAISNRRPDINPDFAGIYPFDWVGDDVTSFKALQGGLLVAPILQKLILNRYAIETLDFADRVAKWDFKRVIPAHLKNNLSYTGKDYRAAFSFLEASGVPPGLPKPLAVDLKTLNDAEINLTESGAIIPRPPLVGGGVSRAQVLAQEIYNCRGKTCTPRSEA